MTLRYSTAQNGQLSPRHKYLLHRESSSTANKTKKKSMKFLWLPLVVRLCQLVLTHFGMFGSPPFFSRLSRHSPEITGFQSSLQASTPCLCHVRAAMPLQSAEAPGLWRLGEQDSTYPHFPRSQRTGAERVSTPNPTVTLSTGLNCHHPTMILSSSWPRS